MFLFKRMDSSKNIDCIIEISKGSSIKYEFDKKNNKLRCDRILHTSMGYPGNYGYIPNTLSEDGDPIDVLLISDYKLKPNILISIKIIGVLLMKDEAGMDEKLLCVPHIDVDPSSEYIYDIDDFPQCLLDKVLHFFQHYKDNEKNKFVNIIGFKNKEYAEKIYLKSLESYANKNLRRDLIIPYDMCGND